MALQRRPHVQLGSSGTHVSLRDGGTSRNPRAQAAVVLNRAGGRKHACMDEAGDEAFV